MQKSPQESLQSYTRGTFRGTYALVRYADDVAIFCPTHAEAMEAKTLLAQWLASRGLRWSEAKTHIRHLTEGFDFLGFHIRHHPAPNSARSGYKLLITPSTGSITQMKRKLKGLWRRHVGSPTVALINEMNPVIRGWSNYFRIGVASKVFADLDNFMYYRAQRYMKRRHPRKSGWWRTTKYWGHTIGPRQDRWVFLDKVRHATLRKFAWTKIVRHRLVPTTYSPDDPTLQDYWRQRRARTHATAPRYRQLFQRQKGLCPGCHQHLENGEETHIHHVIPKQHGGKEDLVNLRLVHRNCHHQIHNIRAPLGVRRLLEPGAR
ncbi:MAG TPA: group II intron maturase-specific domain-containing protein [Candidatus Tectomicrobia bacterium]